MCVRASKQALKASLSFHKVFIILWMRNRSRAAVGPVMLHLSSMLKVTCVFKSFTMLSYTVHIKQPNTHVQIILLYFILHIRDDHHMYQILFYIQGMTIIYVPF